MEIFSPFIKIDSRFRTAFEELLNRRQRFLGVFKDEVEDLRAYDIRNLERQQAEKLMPNWGKPPQMLSSEIGQKAELIRNKAQLGAFVAATDDNSTDPKNFPNFAKKRKFCWQRL